MSDTSYSQEDVEQFMHQSDDRLDTESLTTINYDPPSESLADAPPPSPRSRCPELITGYTPSETNAIAFVNDIFHDTIDFNHTTDKTQNSELPMDQDPGSQTEGSAQPGPSWPQEEQSPPGSLSPSSSSYESQTSSAPITRTQYLDRKQQNIREKFSALSPYFRHYSWLYAVHKYFNCDEFVYMETFQKIQQEENRYAFQHPQPVASAATVTTTVPANTTSINTIPTNTAPTVIQAPYVRYQPYRPLPQTYNYYPMPQLQSVIPRMVSQLVTTSNAPIPSTSFQMPPPPPPVSSATRGKEMTDKFQPSVRLYDIKHKLHYRRP